MPDPTRSTQTTHEALAWFKDFHAVHGRLPGVNETDALRGPTSRLVRRLGGLPGVAAKLELERTALPARQQYTDDELLESLKDWAIRKNLDRAPFCEEAIADFQNGDPIIASGETYRGRFGGWDNALTATGQYRFSWNASDCVSATVRARREFPELNTRKAVQANARRGFTPGVKDVLGHYPDFRVVVNRRLSWEDWQNPVEKLSARRNNIASIVSHGVLALASVDGDLRYFENGMASLHKEDRGPEFDEAMFANLNPLAANTKVGYLWSLGLVEAAFEYAIGGSPEKFATDKLGIGQVGVADLFHPVFQPELDELLA